MEEILGLHQSKYSDTVYSTGVHLRQSDGELDKTMVTLLLREMWMDEHVDMTLFVISDWFLETNNATEPKKRIKMKVVL